MEDVVNSPETAESNVNNEGKIQVGPGTDPLRELADLLRTEEKKAEPSAEKPAGKAKVKPKDLKHAAEMLGVTVEDLYGMGIPSDKIKDMTLGKLKDHMTEREDFTVRSLQFDEDKRRKEAEFVTAERQLHELLSAMPAESLRPDVMKRIAAKQTATIAEERRKTLQAIPEWNDAAVRQNELQQILDHLASYGFPDNYLEGVYDSRAIRYIRDNMLRETRLRKALESVTERKSVNTGKSKLGVSKDAKTQKNVDIIKIIQGK